MPAGFLSSRELIAWESTDTGFDVDGVAIGQGRQALEIVVAHGDSRPTKEDVERLWRERWDQRANPVLAVVLYDSTARVYGPDEDGSVDEVGIEAERLERICESALDEPNRHKARRFLKETLPEAAEGHPGLNNQGLLSLHELVQGVPTRDDWEPALEKSRPLLREDGKDLVSGLGYELESLRGQGYVLRDEGRQTAVAIFLEEGESFEQGQDRFTGDSPITYGLNKAEQENLDRVIVNSGGKLRLYTTNPEDGFGSRGRTDTYVEVDTDLIDEDEAAYLWLLFSAPALRDGGTLEEIMELSEEYAADLGARLRERIYDDVIPDLAQALSRARDLTDPTREELDETYEMALVLLYRLLFVAYGEDERFLPRKENPRYDPRSLKQKARELDEIIAEGIEFDENSTTHWDDVMELVQAIHNGHSEWGLPEYDGTLLSSDPGISPAGGRLAEVELTDDEFGPILQNLLIDETEDGHEGPVDFRNIGVREFGVIYEGLLESELSLADTDLTVETRDDEEVYVPAEGGDSVRVQEGEVYLHGLSGERKSTGTYYTKTRFVEHLLDHSLEPALDDHLERLDELSDREAEDAFWDFSVADIAMGSGHFLVAAVDHIESKFSQYLHERSLPAVEDELDRLEEAAERAFDDAEAAPEIERDQLLRRQVARRCVYGVDINPLATELARLSLWVHTFVPGLPLTFLDYNLVSGDSLSGIGTLDEVTELLDLDQQRLDFFVDGEDTMDQIEDAIAGLGQLAEADAREVKEARATRNRIERELSQTRTAFAILAASRIDDGIDTSVVREDIGKLEDTGTYEKAMEVLREPEPLHFPVSFPDVFHGSDPGFDVIVGNPPWEEATTEPKEFWSRYLPGLQAKSPEEQEHLIDELRDNRPDLVQRFEEEREEQQKRSEVLKADLYGGNLASGSAPEMYLAFAWRFKGLLSTEGYVGIVIPRGLFAGDRTQAFREHLFDSVGFIDVTFLVNSRCWVFDALHPQYEIALSTFRNQGAGGEILPVHGPFTSPEEFDKRADNPPLNLRIEDIRSWTRSAQVPLLPSHHAFETFESMASGTPKLGDDEGDWWAVPATPLKLGKNEDEFLDDGSRLIHRSEEPPNPDFVPVAGGDCLNYWTTDLSQAELWADPELVFDYIFEKRRNSYRIGARSPFSVMDEDWVEDPDTLPCLTHRIAFRDSARRGDTRTVRAAIVPPKTPLVDTAPYLLWPRGTVQDQAFLLGVLNSIPFDWCARVFVQKHVSFYVLKSLPVPRPGHESELKRRLIQIAAGFVAQVSDTEDWSESVAESPVQIETPQDREDFEAEADALVSHLYGLSKDQLKTIYSTFHENWDPTDRQSRALDHYDAWEARLND